MMATTTRDGWRDKEINFLCDFTLSQFVLNSHLSWVLSVSVPAHTRWLEASRAAWGSEHARFSARGRLSSGGQ